MQDDTQKDQYSQKEREKYWQNYWIENKVHEFDENSKKQIYSIDTPPPTVSGKMHMGHAFMYSQMDFIARYKRMMGYNIFYPFGTDDNGLPTQILIENLKKVKAKNLGRKHFTELCINTLEKELRPAYIEDWKRIAISCDWDLFYTTIDRHSQKISQWSFIDLVKKKQAYRANAPAIVCPKCSTAVSQVEMEDLKRTSRLNYIKVSVEGDESLVFATTRPELMMACIAISVHPKDKRYKHLAGRKATIPVSNAKVPILADDMTKMDFGTGAVYWCPYGDAQDVEFVAKHPELEVRHIMDRNGTLNEKAGRYKGMDSEEARKAVLDDWKNEGALIKQEEVEQVINVHERCGHPIEFVAMEQWFIKILEHKRKWLRLGRKLNWYPEHMRNRYDNWVNGLKWDWNISRQIYFGIPFPVWYCKNCKEPILAKEEQLPVDPELAGPPVDTCPKCKCAEFMPEEDIINTWATSSLTPQIAISLLGDEKIKKKLYPISLRPQGHDIISFWLFNTVVKAGLHFDSLPWNDVMITGWALDPNGKKMSKSKGNVVEPQKMIEKYSTDALRFWAASSTLGEDLPFKEKELVAGQKLVKKLFHAARFCYMHLEDYDGKKPKKPEFIGLWLLSKLQRLMLTSTENFERYEYSKTKMEVEKFFWHTFTSNYIEIVKGRLYNADSGSDKKRSAQYVLSESLLAVLKLLAPIMPHITEELYQSYFAKIENKISIHLADWPVVDKKLIDDKLELMGDMMIDIISAVRKYKSQKGLSLKHELEELAISCTDRKIKIEDLIKVAGDDLMAVTGAKKIAAAKDGKIKCDNFNIKISILE